MAVLCDYFFYCCLRCFLSILGRLVILTLIIPRVRPFLVVPMVLILRRVFTVNGFLVRTNRVILVIIFLKIIPVVLRVPAINIAGLVALGLIVFVVIQSVMPTL